MNKLILVNLKMYLNTQKEVDDYIIKTYDLKDKFIVFPPAIYLSKFIQNNFHVGIQNTSHHQSGAYTGEISAKAIQDLGVKYTLIGHSEVRENLQENDELLNQKIAIATQNNLKVILCVGEKAGENAKQVIKKQLTKALNNIHQNVIVAYEPIWAIGTGQTPTTNEIKDITDYIKSIYNVKVLYGGSISEKNINDLMQIPNLDGILIGKSGANPSSLRKIIEVAQK